MKKILLIISLLSMSLFAEFKSIDMAEFKKMQKEGVPVIDIRTEMEWKDFGYIEGSVLETFFNERGQALLADFFYTLGTLVKDKSQPFIIYCAHANRTEVLAEGLVQMGFTKVYDLKGGIEDGWIKKGGKVVK
jgi:rhodanese-related sulfurtransferase